MSDEKERCDPEFATKHARLFPRDKGAPPHYLRCDWFKEDARCRLGDGHAGAHVYATD